MTIVLKLSLFYYNKVPKQLLMLTYFSKDDAENWWIGVLMMLWKQLQKTCSAGGHNFHRCKCLFVRSCRKLVMFDWTQFSLMSWWQKGHFLICFNREPKYSEELSARMWSEIHSARHQYCTTSRLSIYLQLRILMYSFILV
jgi:hypothetical protein